MEINRRRGIRQGKENNIGKERWRKYFMQVLEDSEIEGTARQVNNKQKEETAREELEEEEIEHAVSKKNEE